MATTDQQKELCAKCRRPLTSTGDCINGCPQNDQQMIERLRSQRDRLEREVTRLVVENRELRAALAQTSPVIIKRCTCGAHYTASQWAALKSLGLKPDRDDNGKPIKLDFRNCSSCRSTMAIEIPREADDSEAINAVQAAQLKRSIS